MTDLYLIAHIARGQPAFDIAQRMPCPICEAQGCDECGDGWWWILSTCGYRAYPYWHGKLEDCYWSGQFGEHEDDLNYNIAHMPLHIPDGAADCFACNDRPSRTVAAVGGLLERLGLKKPAPTITRRL